MNNNNNNDKKRNVSNIICALFLGMAEAFVLCAICYPEDSSLLITISIVMAGSAFAMLIIYLIQNLILPYNARRKAALRALGKDGIKVVRTDKTAKLAYKGIYSAICGKTADAENYLRQALDMADVRQNQLFCIEWLIRIYEENGNDPKLLWCYRKAVEYAPDNPEAQSRLGHAYYTDGKLDKAEYCFNQAIRYNPNDGFAYYSLSKIQLIRGEDDKAFESLNTLVKINESHPLAHAAFADYYAMQGNKEKAEEECRKSQLCGYKEPEELNRRINAMLSFHCTDYDDKDLPEIFYRRIEKPGDAEGDK